MSNTVPHARAKLPNIIVPHKPAVPGPNSWAQSAELAGIDKARQANRTGLSKPTNRSKYEDKPILHTSKASPVSNAPATPKKFATIQASALFFSTGKGHHNLKNRAATDPVIPKPLFSNDGDQLSQKNDKKQLAFSSTQDSPNVYPTSRNKPEKTPASAPPLTSNHDSCHGLFEDHIVRAAKSAGLPQPALAQAHCYPEVDNVSSPSPSPTPTHTSFFKSEERSEISDSEAREPREPPGRILEDETLNLKIAGKCGKSGEIHFVEKDKAQRITSFAGVIETVEPPNMKNDQGHLNCGSVDSNFSSEQKLTMGGFLPSTTYSPKDYGGIWENDPHVGFSLPPFTPNPSRHMPNWKMHPRDQSSASGSTVPLAFPELFQERDPVSPFPWAASSRGNSFSSNTILSPCLYPQLTGQDRGNGVPPPSQHSYPEFQPTAVVPAGIAQMELTLHHHIDRCFSGLSKLVTDKVDMATDQILRRVEALEDKVKTSLKGLEGRGRDSKRDITGLSKDILEMLKASDDVKEMIEELKIKMESLGKGVEECSYRSDVGETGHGKVDRTQDQHKHFPPETAQVVSGYVARTHRHESGTSQASRNRHSNRSGRSHHTNALGDAENNIQEKQTPRKKVFAYTDIARGKPPDLKDHPAYSSEQQDSSMPQAEALAGAPTGYGRTEIPLFQNPSFRNGGWYKEAYGS